MRDGSGQQPDPSQQPGQTQQPDQSQPPANNPQPSENSQPVLRGKAYEVVLPVTVRDKKGALITDLQKGDFTLTEEGRPQTIKSLTRDANIPFRIGLLVETNHSMSGALEAERKAAEKFVDLMLPAEPAEGKAADTKNEVFLIHFDREVELLEDFTDSREKMHTELDNMGATRQGQNDHPGTRDYRRGPHRAGPRRPRRQPALRRDIPRFRRGDGAETGAQGAGSLFRRRGSRQQGSPE